MGREEKLSLHALLLTASASRCVRQFSPQELFKSKAIFTPALGMGSQAMEAGEKRPGTPLGNQGNVWKTREEPKGHSAYES